MDRRGRAPRGVARRRGRGGHNERGHRRIPTGANGLRGEARARTRIERNWQDNHQTRPIGYRRLEDLEKETSEDIVIALGDSRSGLEELFRGDRGPLDNGMVQMLLRVFGKMLDSDGPIESLARVLRLIIDYNFDDKISNFVIGLRNEMNQNRQAKAPDHITSSLKVAKALLTMMPARSEKKVTMMVFILQGVIDSLGGMPNVQLLRDEVKTMLQEIDENLRKQREKHTGRKVGAEALLELHEQAPPEDFREIPVFPQLGDIQTNAKPFIRCNLTNRAYQNTDHYLDVQYRLLREDFIRPLRDGIEEIRNFGDHEGEKRHRFENVKVYQEVKVLFAKPDQKGILHRIQFNTDQFKNVRWQNTKRLLYGNLLCFSSDIFRNEVIFAVVSDRRPEDLERGNLTVAFIYDDNDDGSDEEAAELDYDDDDDILGAVGGRPQQGGRQKAKISIDMSKVYTMVETDAYFEAYRHVLSGLRDTKQLPLERYIVQCSEDMHAPEYLRPAFGGRVKYDFSPITGKREEVDILGYDWPSYDDLRLNQSQAEALKLALTNELAVIQGPPGTGKTHVGLEVMKILMANKAIWSRNTADTPVLVVCYTNHALDQFLEGIAKFARKDNIIVRVGGRCQNEVTKEFSLNEIRQKRRKNPDRSASDKRVRTAIWNIKSDLKQLESQLFANSSKLEASLRCVQKLEELSIPDYFLMQFQASRFSNNCDNLTDSLLSWLGLRGKKMEVDYEKEVSKVTGQSRMILEMLGHSEVEVGRAFHELGVDDVAKLHKHIEGNKYIWIQQENDVFDPVADVRDLEEGNDVQEEADMVQQQRMLDTDEFRGLNREENNDRVVTKLLNRMAAMTFEDIMDSGTLKEDNDGWEQTGRDKRKAKKTIRKQLGKTTTMSVVEERNVENIYDLPVEDRWRLYRTWVSRWRDQFRTISDGTVIKYNRLAKQLEELRRREDAQILQGADIVAVTTTGAAKYRDLIYNLKSKIVVVEEAAEVLEAHIITAMPRSTKHLILIGDHQQLKPSPTVYELAKKYNLDTSLFERLMKMKIPYVTLNIQHRMRPEIADLIRPRIYENLEDHESVLYRDEISGLKKSMFFITHSVHEESLKDGRTKQNQHEVDFLVALCDYLLKQGYQPEQITILTMYTGQLFAIRRKMKEKLRRGVRATAVDNYQGEENDIILLSLVRSNDEASIGFLATENRICVSLSRAKQGLYCIGNMDILASKSKMWRQIIGHLENTDGIGESLVLQCKMHPEKLTLVKTASDFNKVPEGGCDLPCETRLECGHKCRKLCHPDDHSGYVCQQPCTVILSCGHKCRGKCGRTCPACVKMVTKVLKCGHEQKVLCKESTENISCKTKVLVNFPCGHSANVHCSDAQKVDQTHCQEKCSDLLDCQHPCKGDCAKCFQGRLHMPCGNPCNRILVCGHSCKSTCSYCPPCEKKCMTKCTHSICGKKCGDPCTLCKEQCPWECQHQKCTKLCSEPCDRQPCNKPCQKQLKCTHQCIGLCGEPCPTLCRICHKKQVTNIFFGDEEEKDARFVMLEDCGHIFTYQSLDQWMKQSVGNKIKMKTCPRCSTTIWRSTRYGNIINKLLRSVNKVKEKQRGNIVLAEESRQELIEEVKAENETRLHYNVEVSHIIGALKRESSSTPGKIVVLEKAYRRLQVLSKLKTASKKLSEEKSVPAEDFKGFYTDMKMVLQWVKVPRSQVSEREDKCFKNEVTRLKYLLKFIDINAKSKSLEISDYNVLEIISKLQKMLLETFQPFNSGIANEVSYLFEKLGELAPQLYSGLGITEDERRMICSAMGFAARGHWFQCPKGHVYAIGECGGAVTTATCPECGSAIGGTGHRLLSTNRTAEQMDGATVSAYERDMQLNNIPPRMLEDLHQNGYF